MKRLFLICLTAFAIISCDEKQEIEPLPCRVNQIIRENISCKAISAYTYTYNQDGVFLKIRGYDKQDTNFYGNDSHIQYFKKNSQVLVYQITNRDSFLLKTMDLNDNGYVKREFFPNGYVCSGDCTNKGYIHKTIEYEYDKDGYLIIQRESVKTLYESGEEENHQDIISYKIENGNQKWATGKHFVREFSYHSLTNIIQVPENLLYGKPNKSLLKEEKLNGQVLYQYEYETKNNLLIMNKINTKNTTFYASGCASPVGSIEKITYYYDCK